MIALIVVLVVLVAFFVISLGVRRFRESPVPAGDWQPTEEVFVDPGSGRRMRVWVDPQDGGRHYVPEGSTPARSD